MTNQQSSSRDLRLMRLMIDVIGGEKHAVSLRQLEEWLNQMVGRPVAARNGHLSQLTKQERAGETFFWLSAAE